MGAFDCRMEPARFQQFTTLVAVPAGAEGKVHLPGARKTVRGVEQREPRPHRVEIIGRSAKGRTP